MSFIPENAESTSSLRLLFEPRQELLNKVKSSSFFDLVIIGGGINGAAFARLAAFNGLKTLLLEKNDYASAGWGKSSRVIQGGGLPYLNRLDFRQAYKGIKAGQELFSCAPHLVRPQRFLIPVADRSCGKRLRIGLALWLYSLVFAKSSERRFGWLGSKDIALYQDQLPQRELEGAYFYLDGVTSENRLVIENIIAARQEGAFCLNYCQVSHLKRLSDGQNLVAWKDQRSHQEFETRCGLIVNCAGPWVPYIGRITPAARAGAALVYSRGTHLLFNKKWNAPSLLLPSPKKGAHYFVWPFAGGTMVGSTDREVKEPTFEPQPSNDEIVELFDFVKEQLPASGLNEDSLYYAYSGIKSLLNKRKTDNTFYFSGRHRWDYQNGMLNLLGGELSTAAQTAYEGLKVAYKLARYSGKVHPLFDRKLPGAGSLSATTQEFISEMSKSGVPESIYIEALERLGSRVKYFREMQSYPKVAANSILTAEIEVAILIEQAETLEDVLSRRLGLEYRYGHGLEVVPDIIDVMSNYKERVGLESEATEYVNKVSSRRELIKAALKKKDKLPRVEALRGSSKAFS